MKNSLKQTISEYRYLSFGAGEKRKLNQEPEIIAARSDMMKNYGLYPSLIVPKPSMRQNYPN